METEWMTTCVGTEESENKRRKKKGKEKEETEGKIRLLGVASNNGSGPSNWQWCGEGKKVMEERPRLSFASLDLHGDRHCPPDLYWTRECPPPSPSGDSNLLFGRVLHVGRRNNGKSEGGNRPVRERSRTTPACRFSLSPLHEAWGCVDARDRYSWQWIGNFLTLFEKEKEDCCAIRSIFGMYFERKGRESLLRVNIW